MSRTLEELQSEALQLDHRARASLAKTLLDSLESLSDAEYEELWIEEGEARLTDFEADRCKAIDGDDVFARARTRTR
ncbi:MAG: addiction module protein [Thermoanaerobaculia bacterium]